MDGQGRALAGVVTGSQSLMQVLRGVLRTLGISCSPFNAWLLLKSLETLEVRMMRAQQSAFELARWLSHQELVTAVHYTGLEHHPSMHWHAASRTAMADCWLSRSSGPGRSLAMD